MLLLVKTVKEEVAGASTLPAREWHGGADKAWWDFCIPFVLSPLSPMPDVIPVCSLVAYIYL